MAECAQLHMTLSGHVLHAMVDLVGRACAVNCRVIAPRTALDIHLELQAPCTQQGVPT